MSTTPNKPTFRGKAARIIMAGTLAVAFAPAIPALADEPTPPTTGAVNDAAVADADTATDTATDAAADTAEQPATSWKDFYAGLGIDTSTGYDAVTSATNFTSRHAADIPTITHRVTNDEGATTSLDGFDASATSAEKTQQVKLQTAVFNDGPSSHYSREFVIYPDDTVEGYNWTDYKNSVYAVTISDGTTTTGAVPWIDYYGESAERGYHYNKLEIALENGTSIDSNQQNVTRFSKFFDESGNLKTGTYTVTVYAKGYTDLTAQINVNPTYTGEAAATDASKAANALALSGLPSDMADPKVTVSHTEGSGRSAVTTYLAGSCSSNGIYTGADIPSDGIVSLDATALAALADDADLTIRIDSSNYQPIVLTSKVAETADLQPAAAAQNWKDFYASLGIDTSTGYDAVTSATNFTSHHAADIPTITHRVTNAFSSTTALDGFDTPSTGSQTVRLQTAVFNDGPSSHYSREFAIYPDDTVSGFNWTDYKNSVYAVTVSDGTTTVGAVPWIDYYGESATQGFHYNKLEIALENGTSIDTNAQNVTRFAKFFENGALKTGTYTVTVYASGYQNLVAQVKVNPTYTGTAAATDASRSSSKIGFTNLPSDIEDAKVTVYHTEGSGRSAVTTYLAGERSSNGIYTGADINADGTVSLDATALAGLADDADLTVRIDSSNYATMTLESKVAQTATFPNTLKASASTKTVKAKTLKKKKVTVSAIKASGAQGKVTYAKASGSKKLTVSKSNGKVTVKKGTKKGTYTAKVRVTAAGNADFASATKTVTVKVKVK